MQRQHKIVLMVVLLCLVFVFCWTPYAVLAFAAILGEYSRVPDIVTVIPHQFAKSSVLWNSVILVAMNPMVSILLVFY